MSVKATGNDYKLLLESVEPRNIADIRDEIRKLLDIGEGQATDIMSSVPIILLDTLPDRKSANRIKKKFKIAEDLGAKIVISKDSLEDMPRLKWPEMPEIARVGEEKKAEEGDALTLAKYNFVVDRRNVFRCPHCDKLFLIKKLTEEEAMEARAQYEIADRLAQKGPEPARASIEEVEPIRELQPQGALLSAADDEIIDLATFEEGLSSLEDEGPQRQAPAGPQVAAAAKSPQGIFRELEGLPSEGPGGDEEAQEPPSPEAVEKESELEELAPEEAMKFFDERRKEDESAQPHKVVAPRRGGARRRMHRLREKQEEKTRRPGPDPRKRMEEAPREAPPAEVQHEEGFYGVVLSRIPSSEKKKSAAKLIVEIAGVHPQEARDMCEGMFINAIRGISEEEANETAAKFREMGITAKVTLQKRKKRQSERRRS